MFLQSLVVGFIVIGCFTYAAWTLMPSATRRTIAQAMLKLPLPAALAVEMRKKAVAASGCGCDGCDAGTAKTSAKATVQPITFRPRPRR